MKQAKISAETLLNASHVFTFAGRGNGGATGAIFL